MGHFKDKTKFSKLNCSNLSGVMLTGVTFLLISCAPAGPQLAHVPTPPAPQKIQLIVHATPIPTPVPSPVPAPVMKFPTVSDLAAVAFEDRHPFAGDEDFNDFLTDFKIVEKVNELNQITDIIVDFYPRAVGASYDHSLLMILSGKKDQPSNISLQTKPLFSGDAVVTLSHYDSQNHLLGAPENLPTDHDVVIFKSTHALFDPGHPHEIVNTVKGNPYKPALQSARLKVHLLDPSDNPVNMDGKIDLSKFRIVLHVMHNPTDTQHDIDIIDVDPTNPDLFDKDGYPYGFIIPANWQWPTEDFGPGHTKKIDAAYPSFAKYREYLQKRANDPSYEASEDTLNWFMNSKVSDYLYPLVPAPKLLPAP
jgi:LruC domain-containing protein